jgi:outer membrane protein TolC
MLVRMMLMLLLPAGVAAQPILTLEEAVAQAVSRDSGVAATRAGGQEAAARETAARARYFPTLTTSESWQRGNAPAFVFSSLLAARQFGVENFAVPILNHPDAVGFFQTTLGVEQSLFDGGRTRAGVDATRAVRVSAEADVRLAEAEVAYETAAAYVGVLTAEAAHRAADAAMAAALEDVERAERRRDSGTATEADVLSLRVHLAAVRQRSLEAQSQAIVARASVNRLRGAALMTPFRTQEPTLSATVATEDERAQWTAEALQARGEIQKADATIRRQEAAQRLAASQWWPQVAAQGAYQWAGIRVAERQGAWVVGAQARWSWNAGGSATADQHAAAAAMARARAERDALTRAVELDVLTVSTRLASATARAHVATAAVREARESARIVRDRYEVGLASVHDVLASAAAIEQAEQHRTSALGDQIMIRAALTRARGRSTE